MMMAIKKTKKKSVQDDAVQDDVRETEIRNKFLLKKDEKSGRSGTDAYLIVEKITYHFELKSTTTGSVTTARDFGMEHIKKLGPKHWLIGKYNKAKKLLEVYYLSPKMMKPWIEKIEKYIKPDFKLLDLIIEEITIKSLNALLGDSEYYSFEEVEKLQKKQIIKHKEKYQSYIDKIKGMIPKEKMLIVLQDRCRYLMHRGSTLNNPHIPKDYIEKNGHKVENQKDLIEILTKHSL